FSSVEKILAVHQTLLKTLYELPRESWPHLNGLGNVFTYISPHWNSILLREFLAIMNSDSSFPLVVVVTPIDSECLEEPAVLICPIDVKVVTQEDVITGIQGTVNKQYVLTKNKLHELQDVFGIDDEEECVVCLTELKDTTILPCNHFSVCQECFAKIETCPICRTKIEAFLRFYHESPEGEESNDKLDREGEAEIEIVQ
ncbi:MAG: RING-HC finger protein, partial [Cytophagales bacterium]|nr:RING-HC finger protein [Cytophagales bacterium]